MWIAVNQGQSSIVTLLLAREDVDINSENFKGETPVYTAISRGNTPIAEMLLKRGVDTNKRPPKGETMLNLAVSHGNSTLISQLLEGGVDMNIANKSGDSPLSQAVSRGDPFIISLLLSAGADINTFIPPEIQFYIAQSAAATRQSHHFCWPIMPKLMFKITTVKRLYTEQYTGATHQLLLCCSATVLIRIAQVSKKKPM